MYFLQPAVTLLICLAALAAHADVMRVSYRAPENAQDRRLDYPIALLRLALDKTVASHGAYSFELTPAMNKSRSILAAKQQTYGNNFVMLSYETYSFACANHTSFSVVRTLQYSLSGASNDALPISQPVWTEARRLFFCVGGSYARCVCRQPCRPKPGERRSDLSTGRWRQT